MVKSAKLFKLNRPRNMGYLKEVFAETKRVQIADFLHSLHAKRLNAALAEVPWHFAFNEGTQHVELQPLQVVSLGPQKIAQIAQAATVRSETEFQYLYENFPIYDSVLSGAPLAPLLRTIFDTMNAASTLDYIRDLTAEPVEFCDMQATRFRAGHFLNEHNDDIEGKNRLLAYVLSFTTSWKQDYGGALEFLSSEGKLIEAFRPKFNTLSIFKIPVIHRVAPVAMHVSQHRVSFTGWYRTR